MQLADIADRFVTAGLALRGGFHPQEPDGVPLLPDGRRPATVVLVGNVGGSMWGAFARSAEIADGALHPLDRWTLRVVGAVADELGAAALFPFGGPPYLPFQRWAMRGESVAPSPLGILIHPDYGLWHAYRAALSFAEILALPPRADRAHPCDGCRDKPCLSACPVGAYTGRNYDVPACIRHIDAPAGGDCMDGGCLARHACPVGREFAHAPAQASFHMQAFRRSNRQP